MSKLPPVPEKSLELLQAVVTTAKSKRRYEPKRLEEYPEKIVFKFGQRKFYVARHLLTQDEVPIYIVEGSRHDHLEDAIDAVSDDGEIELED